MSNDRHAQVLCLKHVYMYYILALTRYSVIIDPQYVTYKAQNWSHCALNSFEIHNPGSNLALHTVAKRLQLLPRANKTGVCS